MAFLFLGFNCTIADSLITRPNKAMTLDEALDHMWREYPFCAKRDIHTPEMREALHVILAAKPHLKKNLVEYWHATEFESDLPPNRIVHKTAPVHPICVGIMRGAGRPGF